MTTPITRSELFVPEIFTEALRTGFSGMKALYGTGAAVVNDTLPASFRGGDSVTVPYFANMGEATDAAEGVELPLSELSMSTEVAQVTRSGVAFEMTRWAQLAASSDPYAEAAAQQVEAIRRRVDKGLIEAAMGTSLIHEASGNLTYDAVVDARSEWGDEDGDIALMVVHSRTLASLLKLKDAVGRPLATDAVNTGLHRFVNIPVVVSDRLAPVGDTYSTLLVKRNALAFWYAGQPRVATQADPRRDTNIVATNFYWVAYRYKTMPGSQHTGVVKITHTNA